MDYGPDPAVQRAQKPRGHMDRLRKSICGLGNRMKLVKSIREAGGWHVKVATKAGYCRVIQKWIFIMHVESAHVDSLLQ